MQIKFFQNIIDLIRGKKKILLITKKDNEITRMLKAKTDTIKVIGDSHSNFFTGKEYLNSKFVLENGANSCEDSIAFFTVYHLGPALAYNLNKYNTKTQAREKVEALIKENYIPENSKIICCFGEIDMRAHVLLQVEKQNRAYNEIVDEIVKNYLEFLLFLKEKNQVYVWGPVATQKDCDAGKLEYPYYGSEVERNKVTEYFNKKLEEVCQTNGIGFVSIFKNLIDENYRTKEKYFADGCHLSRSAWEFAIKELAQKGVFDNIFPRKINC